MFKVEVRGYKRPPQGPEHLSDDYAIKHETTLEFCHEHPLNFNT